MLERRRIYALLELQEERTQALNAILPQVKESKEGGEYCLSEPLIQIH